MTLFQRFYHYPARIIVYHLLLIACAYLALLVAAFLTCTARTVRASATGRLELALAWATLSVLLYFIYLFAWAGHLKAGLNLTPALVAPYLRHPSLVLNTLPISATEFWTALVGVPVAILVPYLLASRHLWAVLCRARLRWRRPAGLFGGWRAFAGAGILLLALGGLIWLRPPFGPAKRFFGDPIFITLLNTNNILPTSGLGAKALEAARRDYHPPAQFQRRNVILIVLDACRADHLGVLGYARDTTPFLDSLQRTGYLHGVRVFTSASCCTFGGVLTLLRSRNWFQMAIHSFGLQDALKQAGYRVHFDLAGDFRNFFNFRLYFGASLDSFADGSSPERHYALNDDRGVIESLAAIGPAEGTPAFFYFHLMATHELGLRLPAFRRYVPADLTPDPVRYTNYYDNGILQADDEIRQLLGLLDQKGYLQDSLVVITGDHGESLGERKRYGHTQNLYAEEITPPLLFYDADPAPYRHLDRAQQIDVAPTILDRLGLPVPASWDGRSLVRGEQERFSYLRLADLYAVLDSTPEHTLKYIYNAREKTEEVYDLVRDPGDQRDIFGTVDAHELQELRGAIGAFGVHPEIGEPRSRALIAK